MATRKDVDLVIRARDEAKGAITSITQALANFTQGQEEFQTTARKTGSTLGQLGSSLSALEKSFGGLTAAGQVASQLDRAAASVTKLEAALNDAVGEAIGFERQARDAARATAQLEQESAQVAAAVARQAASVAQAKAAQDRLTSSTKQAAAERRRLAQADQRITAGIDETRARLLQLQQRYRELAGEIAETETPTKRLVASFASAERRITETSDKLRSQKADLAQVRTAMEALARNVGLVEDRYAGTAASFERQSQALAELEARAKDLSQATNLAQRAQTDLENSARKAAAGLERQDAALEEAKAGYRALEQVADDVQVSLRGLEARVRGPLLRAFGEQAARVQQLQNQFNEASTAAQRYARELQGVENPSEELIGAFARSRQAAAAARQEFREQQAALEQLRAVLRETGGDVDTFASRQKRFESILAQAGASYREYGAAAQAAASETARAANETRRATGTTERYTGALQGAARAGRQATQEQNAFNAALRQFYGDSRTALSFTQRLRSEVLSLIAAYGGIFAVIEGVNRTIDAFRTLEAAQSRLNVVFDGDQLAVSQEIDFLRRQAERLGIEFGTLSDAYTKFAVATQGTNLQGSETRRIFVAVSEAARVNKLDLQQLQGIFKALEQIVSKGTFQMEELRQQLGDRLPGAVQILADGLGVTTEELSKMLEQGQVSSDRLSEFASELEKRFGAGLPAALESTTTAIGRFQNALFQAFLRVANGGFIDAFTDLVNDLADTLNSAQFASFADRVSAALAGLSDAVSFVIRNFDLLVIAVSAFIGLKLSGFVVAAVASLGGLSAAAARTVSSFRAMSFSLSLAAGSMGAASAAAFGLTRALQALLSSTGIGLAVVAIGAAVGYWVTSTEEATAALINHNKIADNVRNTYDQVGDSVDAFRNKLRDITAVEARKNIADLTKETRVLQREVEKVFNSDLAQLPIFEGTGDIFEQYRQGLLTAREARQELSDLFGDIRENLGDDNAELLDALAEKLDDLFKDLVPFEESLAEARDILIAVDGNAEEAAAALERLQGGLNSVDTSAQGAVDQFRAFEAEIRKIREAVPEVAEELERLDERAELRNAYESALRLARTYGQVAEAVREYEGAIARLDDEAIFQGAASGGVGASAALLREFEGFRSRAYYDVNAYRAGFGSDTTTLQDGTVVQIARGSVVSLAEANRDLIRRVIEFQDRIRGQIGEGRFNSFDAQQQAALTSIAYNYGSLPDRILEAVRGGTAEEIAAAIRTLAGDNQGVNRGRRLQEARIFEAGGEFDDAAIIEEITDARKRDRREAERAAEQAEETRQRLERDRLREAGERAREIAEQRQQTQETLSEGEFQIEQQRLINAGLEREAEIRAAVRSARAEDPNITASEVAAIERQVGALFDLKEAQKEIRTEKEKAEAAEQRVNDLISLRSALQDQLNAALERGDEALKVANLEGAIAAVNDELTIAIQKAIELFEALGSSDPAIRAIIERLRALGVTGEEAGNRIEITWGDVANTFANSVTSAFDKFAQSVAQGESAGKAAADAFRAFAADFLRQIATMIIRAIVFNAIMRALGIPAGTPVGVAHSGGIAGSLNRSRTVSPLAFATAIRYHAGGIAGLAPNEVPAILERGEEVLDRGDPRHRFNLGGGAAGGGGGGGGGTKVVNAFDGTSFLEEALSTKEGERLILNFVTANSRAVRSALDR